MQQRSKTGKPVEPVETVSGEPNEEEMVPQQAVTVAAIADAVEAVQVAPGSVDQIPEPGKEDLAEAEAEAEEAAEDLEGSELIDDPVRMYLREIGRVTLLTAADERRLAHQLASGKHLEKAEKELSAGTERPVRSAEVVRALLLRLQEQKPLLDAITEYLAISEPMTLTELMTNEKLRAAIDGEINLEMLETFAQRWEKEIPEVSQSIVQLSLNSRVLPDEIKDVVGDVSVADLGEVLEDADVSQRMDSMEFIFRSHFGNQRR
ncbi:MAG: sigma-70 factor domain-containing protein, partial [Dehalococcoidia bacterium]